MTSPYQGHNPQEPPGAEAALMAFSDELEAARVALKDARDEEVTAEQDWKKAKRRAQFSPECPKAGVFDGIRITVDYVRAWIEDEAADEELTYGLAKAKRQAAKDHHETVRTQGSLAQTLSKSVADSYRGTGGERR